MPLKTKRNALTPKTLTLAVAAAFLPAGALAEPAANQLPTGGQVGAGSVAISTTGTRMQIDQASDKAIINWNCFCIGSNAWVNFNQPSASSVVLNRSTQAAEIFGRMSANGQVFVTSGAGVYFGRTASVDVGALLASNLTIRDQDFLAGRYVFTNEGSSGAVVNEGTIITPAGYAALAGTQVRNNGIIIAQAGTVALAAGDRISLDMIGDGLVKVSVDAAALNALALNAGTLQADGGRVVLTARAANALLDTVINNTGVIRARSLVERNGEIVLDGGGAGVVTNSGTLDASGSIAGTTGGSVKVTGQHVHLAPGSSIDASGVAGGGSVVVKGVDTAYVHGSINARGTGEGSSGGFVETSGGYIEIGQAPDAGPGGTWLIDPYNITVVAGGGTSNNGGSPTFTPNGDDSQIGNALINGQLNAGTNVVLDTGGAGSPGTQAGNITVNASIVKAVANSASLTLNANNNVAINANVSMLNGGVTVNAGGTVSLNASGATDAQVSGTSQSINAQGLTLSARDGRRAVLTNTGGNQTITTGAGGVNLDVLNGAGVAQVVNVAPGGNQTVTTSGTVSVVGGSAAPSTNSGLFVNGAGGQQNVTAGNITLQAASSGNNAGAFVSNTASGGDQNVTVTGTISITGGANGLANRAGIVTNGNQTINGNPNIVVTGGSSGTGAGNLGNAAFIAANATGKQQTINAGNITLVSGSGGTDTSATITSGKQTITATGDVIVTGSSGSNGDSNGTRIGGVGGNAPGPTDLTLTVGRDLILNGGANGSGASLGGGSSGTVAPSHLITVSAGRDVILNGGPGAGARIGSFSGFATPGTGNIAVSAGRDIQLNAAANGASIRTADNVTLTAGGGITENQFNALVVANALSTTSVGTTNLTGDNRLNTYSGSTTGGDLFLHNAQALTIAGPVSSSGGLQLTVQGGLTLNATGQDAIVTSRNGQTVLADSLALRGENGGRAVLQNLVAGGQVVSIGTGGIDLNVIDGAGVAQIANTAAGGHQLVTSGGHISVVGGSAAPSVNSGIFQTGSGGNQTVSASGSITLSGASAGSNKGAFINTSQGDQSVSAGGDLTLAGGAGGNAGIGGASGRNQSVSANNISLSNAAAGGFNSTAFILGSHQQINAAGNVTLTGRGSGGDLAGARIGGGTGSATDLNLQVGGDLILTGGSVANNGVGIGSSAAGTALPNTIAINATGDVILNAGVAGSGARIGSGPNGLASGNLSIGARNIALNGGASPAVIRTADNVTLNATGSINGSSNGFVQAGSLQTSSNGATNLAGPNLLSSYGGTTGFGGNLTLNNTGNLNLTGVSAGGALSLTNNGGLSVQNATVSSNGGQSIAATSLLVSAQNGGTAQLTNGGSGNQIITINGDGTSAGVDVVTNATTGGFATIANNAFGGGQSITVTNADHIRVDGAGGNASLNNFSGSQFVSITGSGANRIEFGSTGARGESRAGAASQTVTAGTAGELGSISITGPGLASRLAGFVSQPGTGSQTVSTSGTLTITGGSAPVQANGFNTGVFHNGQGQQTVNAADIVIRGGTAGSNNSAFIAAQSTGNQVINATGSITITGSDAGSNNRALITSNANQTINGNPDIAIRAGASGTSGTTNAGIVANTAGRQQTINARNIAMNGPASGGTDSFAGISGTHQTINTTGNVTLTGGASGGTLPGVRIGGFGGAAPTPTNLTMNVGGDLILTGGAANNGVGIGGSAAASQPNNITIVTVGSVILNEGAGAGSRIGGANGQVGGGNIAISAGGNIELNGVTQNTAIRTTGNVTLNAGGMIREGASGFVAASQLTTTSGGSTQLTGPNQVAVYNGASASGDVSLVNSGNLTVTGLSASGAGSLTNTGNVTLAGAWTSDTATLSVDGAITQSGAAFIQSSTLNLGATGSATLTGANQVGTFTGSSATGDIVLVNSGDLTVASLSAAGHGAVQNSGAVTLAGPWQSASAAIFGTSIVESASGSVHAGSLTTNSTGATTLNGANQVSHFTGDSQSGDISLHNSSSLLTLGSMNFSGSLSVDQTGALAVPGTITAANQALSATGDVTIGSAAGTGAAGLFASGAITISTPQSIVLQGSNHAFAGASIVAADGLVTMNAGEVHLVGGAAPLAGAAVLGGEVMVTTARDITLTSGSGWNANALLYSRSDITMTVGGILAINGQHRPDNWARVQTERRDGSITLNFPNRHSGGFFVDGFEGKIKHGQDGFFTADKPAKLGHTLFLNYGQ